jgi:hypothetical protein
MRCLLESKFKNPCIVRWIIIKEEQLTKINLGSKKNLQQLKISVNLEHDISYQLIELLKEFMDILPRLTKF